MKMIIMISKQSVQKGLNARNAENVDFQKNMSLAMNFFVHKNVNCNLLQLTFLCTKNSSIFTVILHVISKDLF